MTTTNPETTPATDLAWTLVTLLAERPEALTEAHDSWFGAETDEFPGDPIALDSVSSFEDAGVLTRDAGLVIRTADGAEFQVSVVQSRPANDIVAERGRTFAASGGTKESDR